MDPKILLIPVRRGLDNYFDIHFVSTSASNIIFGSEPSSTNNSWSQWIQIWIRLSVAEVWKSNFEDANRSTTTFSQLIVEVWMCNCVARFLEKVVDLKLRTAEKLLSRVCGFANAEHISLKSCEYTILKVVSSRFGIAIVDMVQTAHLWQHF